MRDTIESVGVYAFTRCTALESVTIPNCVTNFGYGMFYNCHELDGVVLPPTLTVVGEYTFYACSNLTSIDIPDGVTVIGRYAFAGCTNLTAMTLPAGLTELGEETFADCVNLTTIGALPPAGLTVIGMDAMKNTAWWAAQLNGLVYWGQWLMGYKGAIANAQTFGTDLVGIANGAFQNCPDLTAVTLPASLSAVPDGVFRGCSNLTAVTLSSTITHIGSHTFAECVSLPTLSLPAGIQSFGVWTFSDCSSLSDIVLPSGLTQVGYAMFANCRALTNMTIPASVTTLGDGAFLYCSSLASVRFLGDAPPITGATVYGGTAPGLVTWVQQGSKGWNGAWTSTNLPVLWPLNGNHKRTIQHDPTPLVTVTWDACGGTVSPETVTCPADAPYASVCGERPVPTRTGYEFINWLDASSNRIDSVSLVTTAADHTLTAQWQANTYTVTFDPTDGTVSTNTFDVTFGAPYGELPVSTRTGYRVNWLDSAGNVVNSTNIVTTAANHTLTAQWQANTYTVTFDPAGDTVSTNILDVTYNTAYGTLPTATRIGYNFLGWFDSANNPVTSASIVAMTEDHTLTAQWQAKEAGEFFPSETSGSDFPLASIYNGFIYAPDDDGTNLLHAVDGTLTLTVNSRTARVTIALITRAHLLQRRHAHRGRRRTPCRPPLHPHRLDPQPRLPPRHCLE